jgi:glycosyltransferase involved in cell wall biosynthesis
MKDQITLITATYNAQDHFPALIASIRAQTYKNFRWIIADGGSTDGTLSIIKSNNDIVDLLLEGPDFGIYDALNKAIQKVTTPYYLVAGADDTLDPRAMELYSEAVKNSSSDIISAKVMTNNFGILRPLRGQYWRYGHLAYVSQHAVGSLIKTSLHERVGLYSKYYPIAADRYFLLKAIKNYGCVVEARDFIAGVYSCEGLSSSKHYEALLDIFKVDFALAKNPLTVSVYSLIRYIVNIPKFKITKK